MLLIKERGLSPLPICPWGLQLGVVSSPFYITPPPYLEKKIWWFGIRHIILRAEGGYVY